MLLSPYLTCPLSSAKTWSRKSSIMCVLFLPVTGWRNASLNRCHTVEAIVSYKNIPYIELIPFMPTFSAVFNVLINIRSILNLWRRRAGDHYVIAKQERGKRDMNRHGLTPSYCLFFSPAFCIVSRV